MKTILSFQCHQYDCSQFNDIMFSHDNLQYNVVKIACIKYLLTLQEVFNHTKLL